MECCETIGADVSDSHVLCLSLHSFTPNTSHIPFLELRTVLQRRHHQDRVLRQHNFPQPAVGAAPFNSSQDSIGLPGHKSTLLAQWFVALHSATDSSLSHSAPSSVLAHRVERLLPSEWRHQPRTSCTTQSLPLQPLGTFLPLSSSFHYFFLFFFSFTTFIFIRFH